MYPSERIDSIISKDCSEALGINLDLVEKVIRFQFKSANEATHNSTSIELTDLGVFKATKPKLNRKFKTITRKLEFVTRQSLDPTLTDRKRRAALLTLSTIEGNLDFVASKRKTYED